MPDRPEGMAPDHDLPEEELAALLAELPPSPPAWVDRAAGLAFPDEAPDVPAPRPADRPAGP